LFGTHQVPSQTSAAVFTPGYLKLTY